MCDSLLRFTSKRVKFVTSKRVRLSTRKWGVKSIIKINDTLPNQLREKLRCTIGQRNRKRINEYRAQRNRLSVRTFLQASVIRKFLQQKSLQNVQTKLGAPLHIWKRILRFSALIEDHLMLGSLKVESSLKLRPLSFNVTRWKGSLLLPLAAFPDV